jgi:hypothetical protein
MLRQANERGAADALARLKIAGGFLSEVAHNLAGQPARAFIEGPKAFRASGFLSPSNVFWPAVRGPGGSKLNWLARAGTVAAGAGLASQLVHPDPNEGHLAGTLGAMGGLAGSMYGYPVLGMLGAPMLSSAGSSLGRGVGHLLGSHPKDQFP